MVILLGIYKVLTKDTIIDLLISSVVDPTHGGLTQSIQIDSSNVYLYNSSDIQILSIISTGYYYLTFDVEDLASNNVNNQIKFLSRYSYII
jgi:hypothetical protein